MWGRRLRAFLGRLALVLAALALMLIIIPPVYAYIIARGDYVPRHQFFYEVLQPDEYLGFTMRPNITTTLEWIDLTQSYATDAHGFLNPVYAPLAPLAVVGDSFTASTFVPKADRWPNLLAGRLGTTVYNYGVEGYAPWQYRRLIERDVSQAGHRLLLINIFGNDIGKNDPRLIGNSAYDNGWWMYETPYVYTLARTLHLVYGVGGQSDDVGPDSNPAAPATTPAAVLDPQWLADDLRQFDAIVETARAAGMVPVFILIPSDRQVRNRAGGFDEDVYYPAYCQYLTANDVPCYDMTPDLAAYHVATGENLYHLGHWDVPGNHLAAELIATFLQENAIVDVIYAPING